MTSSKNGWVQRLSNPTTKTIKNLTVYLNASSVITPGHQLFTGTESFFILLAEVTAFVFHVCPIIRLNDDIDISTPSVYGISSAT